MREENDYYPTPYPLALAALRLIKDQAQPGHSLDVVDAGCGQGIWGRAWRAVYGWEDYLMGAELVQRPIPANVYNEILWQDFTRFDRHADIFIGNPPFSLADEFVDRALEMVRPGGVVLYLLGLGFLAGSARYERLWRWHPPQSVFVVPNRPSFVGAGTGKRDIAIYVWRDGPARPVDWLMWKEPGQTLTDLWRG